MRISPDDPSHARAQAAVDRWLEHAGFRLTSATYHETWPDDMIEIVKGRYSLTALYLRARADRVAIHRQWPVEFEYEIKTFPTDPKMNLAIEALPLLHAVRRAELGVRTLYACLNDAGEECGFWCDDVPPVWKTHIPANAKPCPDCYVDVLSWFGEPELLPRVRGSGDPYVLIRRADALRLPSWRAQVAGLFQSCSQPGVHSARP